MQVRELKKVCKVFQVLRQLQTALFVSLLDPNITAASIEPLIINSPAADLQEAA